MGCQEGNSSCLDFDRSQGHDPKHVLELYRQSVGDRESYKASPLRIHPLRKLILSL
jgi:hypothetical protein